MDHPIFRHTAPVEILLDVQNYHDMDCHHCGDGSILIMRDSATFALRWDVVYCCRCGQRYHVPEENRQKFIGYDYTQELFGK